MFELRFSTMLRRGREYFQIHLPFALDGDTHAFIRNALGGDLFPTAGIAENASLACLGNACEPARASASRREIFGFP